MPRGLLAAGDAAALLAFTVLGLRFHNIAPSAAEVLRTVGPLWVAWFAASALWRAYARPGAWRPVATWLTAVPTGLALRQVLLGRPFGPSFLVFLGVAGALTAGFLLAWRLVAALVRLRRQDAVGQARS